MPVTAYAIQFLAVGRGLRVWDQQEDSERSKEKAGQAGGNKLV